MNAKRILYDYAVENERCNRNYKLEQLEELFLNNITHSQKLLYDELQDEISRYTDKRCYYFFCEGMKVNMF